MRTKLNRRERKAVKNYFGLSRIMRKNNTWYGIDSKCWGDGYKEISFLIEEAEEMQLI